MDRVEQYRRNAEEAERLAEKSLSPFERESYRQIAKGWRDLAEAEKLTHERGV